MLRWIGESIPAASLLPLSPRQHDRGTLRWARRFRSWLRNRRPVLGQRRWSWHRRGMPASAPPLHGSRPSAGSPFHGHSRHNEAASTKSGGRACRNATLVFLRAAPDRQTALGPTQHLKRLCSAGHPQPATTTRAWNYTRNIRASGSRRSSRAATRAHAGGGLMLPNWQPGTGHTNDVIV